MKYASYGKTWKNWVKFVFYVMHFFLVAHLKETDTFSFEFRLLQTPTYKIIIKIF